MSAELAAPLARLAKGSPGLAPLLESAARAARTDAPVLVLGEAGTGRSALARAIHASSRRAHAPLVEVDPGALAPALVESELFGHRAGAFTGAERDRAGRLELAGGGSLLLDHVEEMPLGAQPKLLRVLAEGTFAPLGGEERRADVRFLAVAAEDLEERVSAGSFRRDLFHRLEVVAFRLPPLRRRRGDLPHLIEALVADLAERFGGEPRRLSAAARRWMAEHPWPGNLRELRNVLERAWIASDDERLDPPAPRGAPGAPPMSLAEVERRQIERALAYTRGHQGEAARLLGISRKTLWQKRRRHGLP